MKFFRYLARGLGIIFSSLNILIGVIVGSVFGALLAFLLMAGLNDGGDFAATWLWWVVPGAIFGAIAGIKAWPLMLGLFLGEVADAGDTDLGFDVNDSGDTDAKFDKELSDSRQATRHENDGAW